jgi:YD repeat-containing protein
MIARATTGTSARIRARPGECDVIVRALERVTDQEASSGQSRPGAYQLMTPCTGSPASSLSGGPTQSYAYDANSNRTSWDDGTNSTTYDYNATDELTAQHTTGSDRYYTYDTYGNLTSSAVVLGGTTAYTYDEANHLASITPPAGSASSFSVDALGRQWTKSVGGSLAETYGYAATSDSVVQIDRRSSPYGEP